MSDTLFKSGTVIRHEWLNDVNNFVYKEYVNVKRFGAVGDGVSDDTAAIEAAYAYANATKYDYIANPPDFYKVASKVVYFPSGDYVYNGAGVSAATWMCETKGESKSTTRLRITSNVYFQTATSGVMFYGMSNMHIYGGKGVFISTSTATNTLSQIVIEDNLFFNYTETCIGHLSQDFPHWKIQRNQFHGALTSGERTSFGIVLSGRADGCEIDGNEFQENKVSIKLAVSTNGTVASIISQNIFERWTTSPGNLSSYDLWIVPSTNAPTLTGGTGTGTMINDNRFGNENLLAQDYHIIFAEESAGTSAFTKLPSITTSTKFVGGIQVKGNIVFGTGASSTAFIYSTTPNIWGCEFDNVTTGTPIATLEILSSAVSDTNNSQNTTNIIRQQHVGGPAYFLPAPASTYSGIFEDPLSLFQGKNTVPSYWKTGYSPEATELTTQFVNSFTGANSSVSQVTDAAGGTEAVELTSSALNGYIATTTNTLTAGKMGFLCFDIKQGSSLPLPYVRVAFTDNSGINNAIVDRLIGVTSGWKRITIPFCMTAASSVNTLQFQATAYLVGTATKVQIGRVRVYHSTEPVHPYTKVLDSGLVGYTIGAVAANTTVSTTIAVQGAALGDFCLVSYGATLTGMIQHALVTSANTVTVYTYNPSGGSITPPANSVRVRVIKAV